MSNSRRRRGNQQVVPVEFEPVTLRLETPAHGGAVIAHGEDGHLYFVRGGIPEELVVARVTAVQKKYSWAEVIEVLEPSPDRVMPGPRPGADLSHLSPRAQLEWKTAVLNDQLRRVGGADLSSVIESIYGEGGLRVEPAPGDENGALWRRRTRANFKVSKNGNLAVRQYRSNDLLEVTEFPLLDPCFEVAGLFTDARWKKLWKPGDRVELVAPSASEPRVIIGKKTFDLQGKPASQNTGWKVTADGKEAVFRVDAQGFWQTHLRAADVLVGQVLEAAGDVRGKGIVELYSGSGLFTYFLAQAAGRNGAVVSIEGNERAVGDAAVNLSGLRASAPVELFVGSVDGPAVTEAAAQLPGDADLVVLDPPRAGAGSDVIQAIAGLGAARVVLVSCDPAAGARDLQLLLAEGFQLETLTAWDLFPQTHHFEMVSALSK